MDSSSPVDNDFETHLGGRPNVVAWAPGRIEFLGNHTDYNLGHVLGATVDRGVRVAVRATEQPRLRFRAMGQENGEVDIPLEPESIERLEGPPESGWANYPLGVFKMLIQEGLEVETGFDLAVRGDLPIGAGLSSSAALEVATALALSKLYGFTFRDRDQLMQVAWRAETEFVGVPCGMLDQSVVVFGDVNRLVWIDCKAGTSQTIPFSSELQFWIFNTAEKHSLIDSLYAERNRECREAMRTLKTCYPHIEGLCDLSSAEVEARREMLGADHAKRALHVTRENERVRRAIAELQGGRPNLEEMGALLNASHTSSRELFENSTEHLDFLAEALQRAEGVIGARLTGGGFGGAVLAVTSPDFDSTAARVIADAYSEATGKPLEPLHVTTGSGARVVAANSGS